jgi:hypothetical protein
VSIIERSTAQSRKVLEQLGDVKAWYDIIVADDASRLALESPANPLRAGYRVLVKDDGVIWAKQSGAYGAWIGPVEFKGDTGQKGWSPQLVAEADGARRVIKLAGYVGGEGVPPTDNVGQYLKADGTWTGTIGDAVDFRGEGFSFKGAYSGVTSYAEGDVARENGSSWIALQPTTGNAPPTLPTTSNAYWALLAQKGNDGAGTIVSLVEGDGISIDNTDPANPVISADAQPLDLVAGTGVQIDLSVPTSPVISVDPVIGSARTLYFTGSGIYTRTPGAKSVDLVTQGPGGGSSGCSGAAASVGMGNAGSAGAEAHKHLDFSLRSISGISQANPGVVTSNGHGFKNGTVVKIAGVVGMTSLNGNTYTVAGATTNTFQLSGVNTTSFGAYVSGGTLDFVSCPVTIGAAGLAGVGAASPTAGGNGGTTSIGGYCEAAGGIGGTVTGICTAGTSVTSSNQNDGADTGVGDLIVPGQNSQRGLRLSGTTYFSANAGGNSRLGAGGRTIGGGDGYPGKGYGSGAGGPVSTDATHRNGAAGAPGLAIVSENF